MLQVSPGTDPGQACLLAALGGGQVAVCVAQHLGDQLGGLRGQPFGSRVAPARVAPKSRSTSSWATSFVAGTLATLGLVFAAPLVAGFALELTPADYFVIMLLAFVACSAVLGSSRIRGFASLLLGLTIGLVGLDPITGQQRLTFGLPQLVEGIDIIVAVGIFAVGEALWVAAHLRRRPPEVIPVGQPWLRGTALGFPFGALPAGGAEIPTFLSYAMEKRLSKHPEQFGNGAIEGVDGPEATNNASAAGTLVPLLTLGLPTSAIAAVMLAAFRQYGIQPGPQLFSHEPELVWGLIASLFIGNTLLLVLNLPLAPVWTKLLRIPRPYLYAGILFFASMGVYVVNGSPVDLVILLGLGALGLLLRRYGLPIAPVVIGVILGPRAEQQMRRAFQLADGSVLGLVDNAFAITGYAVITLILAWPLARWLLRRTRTTPAPV